MVWPSCDESCSNTTRGMMSVLLPAANGHDRPQRFCRPALRLDLCRGESQAEREHRAASRSVFMTGSLCPARLSIGLPSSFVQYIVALDFMPNRHNLPTWICAICERSSPSPSRAPSRRRQLAWESRSRRCPVRSKTSKHELGIRLFDRIRRRLVLTSEGEQLLGDCRGILGAIGSLTERAQLLRRPDAGVLKVAATPQTIDGVLSASCLATRKRRPNVQIKLSEAFGAPLLDDAGTR